MLNRFFSKKSILKLIISVVIGRVDFMLSRLG